MDYHQETGTYSKMVKYKQYTLAKNSHALYLYDMSKKEPEYFKLLDKHLKQLETNAKELLARYEKAIPN